MLAICRRHPVQSRFTRALVGSVCLAVLAAAPAVTAQTIVADSFDQWSTSGTQGENGWSNGYYNLTQDGDSTYQTGDFIPFTNDGSGDAVSPGGNHWSGSAWDLTGSGGPWTTIGQESTHPNGTNSDPGDEHWTIRRWESNHDGAVTVT